MGKVPLPVKVPSSINSYSLGQNMTIDNAEFLYNKNLENTNRRFLSYLSTKHELWVLKRTVSLRWFHKVHTIIVLF